MSLTAKVKRIVPVREGLHQAICYLVADSGTHTDERWGKEIHKVIIGWELPQERIDIDRDGETKNLPRAISRHYTLSLHKKSNLRQNLGTWRGRDFTTDELDGFDLKNILGKPCQLQVMHNKSDDGRLFANISAVMPWPQGMPVPLQENANQYFSFEESSEPPDTLPDWIVEIIEASHEWQAMQQGAAGPEETIPPPARASETVEEDNIPF